MKVVGDADGPVIKLLLCPDVMLDKSIIRGLTPAKQSVLG